MKDQNILFIEDEKRILSIDKIRGGIMAQEFNKQTGVIKGAIIGESGQIEEYKRGLMK